LKNSQTAIRGTSGATYTKSYAQTFKRWGHHVSLPNHNMVTSDLFYLRLSQAYKCFGQFVSLKMLHLKRFMFAQNGLFQTKHFRCQSFYKN